MFLPRLEGLGLVCVRGASANVQESPIPPIGIYSPLLSPLSVPLVVLLRFSPYTHLLLCLPLISLEIQITSYMHAQFSWATAQVSRVKSKSSQLIYADAEAQDSIVFFVTRLAPCLLSKTFVCCQPLGSLHLLC